MRASPQPNDSDQRFSIRFWILLPFAGAGAGVASGLLMKLLRVSQHLAFGYGEESFLQGVEQASPERRILALIAAGVLGSIALYTLRRITERGGTDLSQTVWRDSGKMPLISTSCRAMLSVILVGMGAAVGRETALKQAGGLVASAFAELAKLSSEEQRILVACGIGAGMAAAYNVPFGGALFAIEVLLGTVAIPPVLAALLTSFIAVWTSYLLLPNAATYLVEPMHTSASLLVWAIFAGPIAGLFSVVYVKVIRWATTHSPQGWKILAAPFAVLAALGLAAVPYPQLLGNGKNVVQLTLSETVPIGLVVALLILRPLATAICFRAGIPGGLFTPTMTFGALLGGVLAWLWRFVWPSTEVPAQSLVTSGAVLAAASQAPISAVVFILELTHQLSGIMLPLLLAAGTATFTMRLFETGSIYSVKVKQEATRSPEVSPARRRDLPV